MRFSGKILALLPACAFALLAAVPAPAAAATMIATFTGTAIGVSNFDHAFGNSNFILFAPATATFTYDPTLEAVHHGLGGSFVTGGSTLGDVSPILSASLTINGHTLTFNTGQLGTVTLGANSFDISSLYAIPGLGEEINAGLLSAGIPNSFTSPFSTTGLGGGSFGYGSLRSGTDGALLFSELSVTGLSSAVPEPSTWAMLLLGFGGIGFVLRRRQAWTLSAAAKA
jgi:PEP-CTERM motif